MKNQTRSNVVNELKKTCQFLPVKKERCAQLAETATIVLMEIYNKALKAQLPRVGKMHICPKR
jgi:hypothetical protein